MSLGTIQLGQLQLGNDPVSGSTSPFERVATLAKTHLAAAISSGDTTLQVMDGSLFPTQGQFRVLIDTEYILVTSVSGTTWTVVRAVESSTAAAHAVGAVVTNLFTAGAYTQMVTDRCLSDSTALLPSAALAGRVRIPTDNVRLEYDNGSSLSYWGPNVYRLKTPVFANFAWFNQGSATATTFNGGFVMTSTDTSGAVNLHILEKSPPATPYNVTIGVMFAGQYALHNFGLCWRDSVSSKIVRTGLYINGDNVLHYLWGYYANETVNYTSTSVLQATPIVMNGIIWLRSSDNGTTRSASISTDGQHFVQMYSESNTTYCTPNKIGIFLENQSSTNPNKTILTVLHYEES